MSKKPEEVLRASYRQQPCLQQKTGTPPRIRSDPNRHP